MYNLLKRFSLLIALSLIAFGSAYGQVMIDGIQYSTLKAAFDAINAGTHQGNINVEIIGNTTETATAVLNASGVGSANYSQVNIYPTATATITSSVQNGIIELQDADYVTIDGRIGMSGSAPALTIQSTATSNGVCVRLTKTTSGDGPRNNTIRYVNFVGATATTSSIYGILAGATGTTLTTGASGINNLTIEYNRFRSVYYGIRINGISGGLAQNTVVSNNNFGNNATVNHGVAYPIYMNFTNLANVNNNIARINISTTLYYLYFVSSTNPTITGNILENTATTGGWSIYPLYMSGTTSANISDNIFRSITATSIFYGIYLLSSSNTFSISNNLFENISSTTFYGIYTSSSSGNAFNNTIRNSNTTGTTYGIYLTSSANSNLTSNTIENITSSSSIYGIFITGSGSVTTQRNVIRNLTSTSTSTTVIAAGLLIAGTSPNNVIVNNAISGIFDNANKTSTLYFLSGIKIDGGTGHQIYHNSVNLYGTSTATNAAANFSAALLVSSSSATGMNIRNNVFSNSRVSFTGSKAFAIYIAGTTLPTGTTINYNDYYASGTQAVLGYLNADRPTLTDWQAITTQDANSVSLDPVFNSNTVLIPYTTSPLIGLGTPISTVTVDLLGNVRSASAPTLGAYENAGDVVAPSISFTPLANTALTTNRTLVAQITDLSGISTTNLPRVYYKKSTNANTFIDNTNTTDGWKYTVGNQTGSTEFTFTIDNSLINGGISAGDVIQYFIIAQDEAGVVGTSSGTFATSPNSTDLTSTNFPITGVSTSYNIAVAFSGTYQVGVGQTYTNLTGTDGIFNAINNNVVTGNLIIEIVSDIDEPGAVALNQQAEEGGSGFTITIKPSGAPRILTFNKTGSCIIINQADRVTIDGLLNGQNALTVRNISTATATNIIDIAGSSTNGATDVTIKNLNIIGTVNTGSTVNGIILRDIAGGNNATSHNLSILNNKIKKVYAGIGILGNGINGLQIIGNEIGDPLDTMTVRVRGIVIQGCNAPIVKNNYIYNMVLASSPNLAAIDLASGNIPNPVIEGNIITGLSNTSTAGYGAWGINIAANVTNATITNNMLSNFYSYGWNNTSTSDNDFAIRIAAACDGINIYHNTINMAGTIQPNTQNPRNAAVLVTTNTAKNIRARNNIFINATSHVSASAQSTIYWLAFTYADTLGYQIDHNHYFNGGNKPVFAVFGTTTYTTFDAYKTAVAPLGFDVNSTYSNLTFIAHNNPIVQGTSLLDVTLRKPIFTGMPATDIHGETRNAVNNLAGADIAEPSSITIQTNLPLLTKKGSNATFELTFVPAISAFGDGIVRNVPVGHFPGFTYQWFFNNNPITSGVNNITINNNTLSISSTNPTHAGTYYATVTYGSLTAQTGNSVLEIETLEPELLSPANNSTDHPIGSVTLTWVPALDATAYVLQVSTDPNFNTILVEIDTTASSYQLTNLQYLTDYYWRVKGYNSQNESQFTTAWKFTTRPAIYPIVLVSPANNAQDLPKQVNFSWNSNVDATQYEIQIATDVNFTNIYFTNTTTELSQTVELNYETEYWWRVRGLNSNYTGLWSETRKLKVRPAIFPVVLISPANNATDLNININFSWQNNIDATGYILEIYSDQYLITKVAEINTTSTNYLYYGLDFNQSYWWRVKAYNNQYQSAWSVVRSFTTASSPTPFITIGTGTSGQSYPLDRYYNMSVSEAIYLASEIGMPVTITSIAYNKVGGTDLNPIGPVSIFMKHTNDNSLASGTYDTTTYTRVYHGAFPNNLATGWHSVNLTTPFAYNGTSNLAVLVVKHNQAWISSYPTYAFTTVTPNRHRAARDDNNMPTSLIASSSLPNVRFGFSVAPLTIPTLTAPANNATDVIANVNFSWQSVTDATHYRIQIATDAYFTNIIKNEVITTNSATFQLGYTTTYYWRVRAVNSFNVSDWSEARSFTTAPYVLLGTYNIGSGTNADFPTFTAFFNEINVNGAKIGGDVNLVAISDVVEPAQVNINQFEEYFGTGHEVKITTDAQSLRTISANVPDGAVFKLNGVDNITFDGVDQKLRILNTSSTTGVAIWLASTNDDPQGTENIEIRNTILATSTEDINLYNTAGIFSGASTSIGATPIAPNNNVKIENNIFYNAKRGILFQGHVANRPTGVEIKNNVFGSDEFAGLLYNGFELYNLNAPIVENNTVINPQNIAIVINSANNALVKDNEIYTSRPDLYPGAQYGINVANSTSANIKHNNIKHFRTYGIFIQSSANAIVEQNSISNSGLLNNSITSISGIFASTGANQGLTIRFNKIYDLNSTYFAASANGAAYGINISGNTVNSASTPIRIENNMIWNISGYGSVNPTYVQNNPFAIVISNGRYINIYNNTVLMNGALHSGVGYSGVLFISNPGVQDVDVRNNIFVNKTSASTAQNYIYYVQNASMLTQLDHNIYQLAGSANLRIGYTINNATSHASLSAWQLATGKDLNAKMKTVPFQTNIPFVTYAVMSDPEFVSPALLTTNDIFGITRTAANNVKGANIPENNDVAARFIIFNSIQTNSLNMAWINGNGQGRLVLVSTDDLSANDWFEIISKLDGNLSTYATTTGHLQTAIEINYGSKKAYVVRSLSGAARTTTISGLTPSTRYNFFVVEYYTAGTVRFNPFASTMNPRSVETAFDVTAPVIAAATNVSYDMFTANWNYYVSQPVDGFEIWLDGDIFDVSNNSNGSGYSVDLFATANTQYQYKVRAKRGAAVSDWSAIQTVNTYPMNAITGPSSICINAATSYNISLGNVVLGNINWTSSMPQSTFTPTANGVTATWLNNGYAFLIANITDTYGNTGSIIYPVVVNTLPVVTVPSGFEICAAGAPQTLTGATPAGGVYSGPGVVGGVFYPSQAGVGTHIITYTFTDANGCSNSGTFNITVINSITVTAPANIEVCIDANPITLTGGLPEGGVYAGPGVVNGVFYPAQAGAGTHTLTYTYTDQYSCVNTAQFTAKVNALPQITVPANFAVCVDAPEFNLTGATPLGGTYTINGVPTTSFNPALAGVGEHTVTYTFTDGKGCTNSAQYVITVNPLPNITVPNNMEVCFIDQPFALTFATPLGGIYSGNGVTNNVFDPSQAGAGTHTITYTYTDANGCVNSGNFNITVIAVPVFTTQPTDVTAQEFSDVTFTVETADPTNTIQWQVKTVGGNWTNIPGATSPALTLTYILNSMNGNQYRAIATSCTSTISNEVTLNVVQLPNQATNINWITWGRTQITFNWTNGTGNGRIVVATKQASWPANAFVPQNDVDYVANPVFGAANSKHTVNGEDYYVVYNGTGNGPVTVTNLERLQYYTFHVFEYNRLGSTIIYNPYPELLANNPRTRQTARKDADETETVATSFELTSVTPNPATDRISFSINTAASTNYRIELINVLGEAVYTNDVKLSAGSHNFDIELSSTRGQLPSGNYFLRVTGNGETATRSFVIVK